MDTRFDTPNQWEATKDKTAEYTLGSKDARAQATNDAQAYYGGTTAEPASFDTPDVPPTAVGDTRDAMIGRNIDTEDKAQESAYKAQAAGQQAANETREQLYGKNYPGHVQDKATELKDKAQAKAKDFSNDVQDKWNSNARVDDADFGDKAKNALHNAGEDIKGGFEKLKDKITGDDEPRVQ